MIFSFCGFTALPMECSCEMSVGNFSGTILAVVRKTEYVYVTFIYIGNKNNNQQCSNNCNDCVTRLMVE